MVRFGPYNTPLISRAERYALRCEKKLKAEALKKSLEKVSRDSDEEDNKNDDQVNEINANKEIIVNANEVNNKDNNETNMEIVEKINIENGEEVNIEDDNETNMETVEIVNIENGEEVNIEDDNETNMEIVETVNIEDDDEDDVIFVDVDEENNINYHEINMEIGVEVNIEIVEIDEESNPEPCDDRDEQCEVQPVDQAGSFRPKVQDSDEECDVRIKNEEYGESYEFYKSWPQRPSEDANNEWPGPPPAEPIQPTEPVVPAKPTMLTSKYRAMAQNMPNYSEHVETVFGNAPYDENTFGEELRPYIPAFDHMRLWFVKSRVFHMGNSKDYMLMQEEMAEFCFINEFMASPIKVYVCEACNKSFLTEAGCKLLHRLFKLCTAREEEHATLEPCSGEN